MKRLGSLALYVLVACPSSKTPPDSGVVDAGPKGLTEQEPNDRPDQAMPLTETSVVDARLEVNPAKPDEDWYLLAPPAPRTADVTVSGIPGADVVMEIYDVDKNRLASINSEGEGKP